MTDDAKKRDLPHWLWSARDLTVTVRAGSVPPPAADAPEDEREPRLVCRAEIGRGGMGSVHQATDTRLLRDVALKRLEPELGDHSLGVAAFIAEAQITGQLDHPNIVPVHEIAVDENGRVYFTMKLVQGVNLHDWLKDPARPVGSPERLGQGLEILLRVCDALSFAHSRGVIHRDLKPANVMVGPFGQVYLMDWGLARLTGEGVKVAAVLNRSLARLRGAAGTLVYMAPEQARGDFEAQDQRTDVFGLGAFLYQIVTGEPPYGREKDMSTLLDHLQRGAFTPPQQLLGSVGVSRRILRIIERAMAADPAQRFASVADFKAAVQRFLHAGLYLPRQGFPPGTAIMTEGEPGDRAYIIVSGECVAYRTVEGKRVELRRMGRGDVVGELAILSDKPRSATVEAVTMVTALVLSRAEIDEGLGGDDTWLAALVRALAARFAEVDDRASIAPGAS